MDFTKLADYGAVIFSIGAIVYVVRLFVSFTQNHIAHNTEASIKLTDAVKQLIHFLERTR